MPKLSGLIPNVIDRKLAELMAYKPYQGTYDPTMLGLAKKAGIDPLSLGKVVNTGIDFVPVLGDMKAVEDGLRMVRENSPGMGAFNMATAIPGLGDVMAMGKGAAPMLGAMTAFHGSPHKFDKFSLDAIGTGEGAQAYGHGLYFAENPGVANTYRSVNTDMYIDGKKFDSENYKGVDGLDNLAVLALRARNGNVDEAIKYAKTIDPDIAKQLESFDRSRLTVNNGNLYEVDIPDEAIDKMLDWDAPLPISQRKAIFAQIRNNPSLKNTNKYLKSGMTGEDLYRYLQTDMPGASQGAASDYLKSIGIPGIRYLDGDSRTAGEGTRNFVVFDDSLIKVLKRNGEMLGAMTAFGKMPPGELGADTMARRTIFDVAGLPNHGRGLIQGKANDLAAMLKSRGFDVEVTHSGSRVGPSSYISIYDPETGRFFKNQVRLSGHSKGAFENAAVWNVTDDDFQSVIAAAMDMRAMGPSQLMRGDLQKEVAVINKRLKSARRKLEKGKELTNSEKELIDRLKRNGEDL